LKQNVESQYPSGFDTRVGGVQYHETPNNNIETNTTPQKALSKTNICTTYSYNYRT